MRKLGKFSRSWEENEAFSGYNMPTGYTQILDDNPEMGASKWLREVLIRNLGLCSQIRDEPLNLSEVEIEKKIRSAAYEDVNFHKKEIKVSRSELSRLRRLSERRWGNEYVKYRVDVIKRNEILRKNHVEFNERHQAVRRDLEKIISSEAAEITKSVAKFGLQQLDITKDDYGSSPEPLLTICQFKQKKTKDLIRGVNYHEEELRHSVELMNERIDARRQIRKDVSSILG